MQQWAYAKVVEIFGADLRSLATFRIVLALLALSDLANRATDLSAHYTDAGIMPRTVLVEQVLSPWAFSIHLMNGGRLFQALLFGVAALAAFGMLVGYRTRLMTFVVWALLLSIQLRNPLLNGSESPMLRMLFFWGMLLPLGAYWSVDRARSALPRPSPRFLSLATFGLFMQIAFVYWFTAALKAGPEWRSDYTALYYALSLDQLATPIGHLLLDFPSLLQVMTLRHGRARGHRSAPAVLPVLHRSGPHRGRAGLYGLPLRHMADDGHRDLPLDQRVLHGLLFPHLVLGQGFDAPLRAVAASRARPPPATRDGAVGRRSRRLLKGGRVVPHGSPATPVRGPAPWQPGRYGTPETRHDGALSEDPEPAELRSSLAANLLAFFFIFYILCWNLTTVTSFTLPERTVPLGPFLGLDQYWGMFAPSPSNEDGWYVIPGELRDGEKVDLMPITRDDYAMHPVSYEKPQDIPATYKNEHWRKYLENIYNQDHAGQRLYFGQYICRQWNAHHTGADTLETFRIIYMLELTLPDYRQSKPEKVDLWNHTC